METNENISNYRTAALTKMEDLRKQGFNEEFQISEEGLKSLTTNKIYHPEEIHIKNFFRYEGDTNPEDMSILYAIETQDGLKGTIIDAFGMYSDDELGSFMKQVEKAGDSKDR